MGLAGKYSTKHDDQAAAAAEVISSLDKRAQPHMLQGVMAHGSAFNLSRVWQTGIKSQIVYDRELKPTSERLAMPLPRRGVHWCAQCELQSASRGPVLAWVTHESRQTWSLTFKLILKFLTKDYRVIINEQICFMQLLCPV